MAVDAYMVFKTDSGFLPSESSVDLSKEASLVVNANNINFSSMKGNIFEVEDYSFDIEQTLNIGSSTSGSGAGKVAFNPFSITKPIDKSSPTFFQMACSGKAFPNVSLALRKTSGDGATSGSTAGFIFIRFDFRLVAVKTVSWSHNDDVPKETISFEYGALAVSYVPQDATGKQQSAVAGGWNRVLNIASTSAGGITAG